MKDVFGAMAALGGLAVLAAIAFIVFGIIQKGVAIPDPFYMKLMAGGGIAYMVGQLGFIAFGGKVKTGRN